MITRTVQHLFSAVSAGVVLIALASPAIATDRDRLSYIVVLDDHAGGDASARTAAMIIGSGGVITRTYGSALLGFAATMSPARAIALSSADGVAYVVRDEHTTVAPDTVQPEAPWHLDRIDQRNLPLNGRYRYDASGAGVSAYVIDTGIRITHAEFAGRAQYGHDFVDDDATADDCNGHGTHVAGLVAGETYGVAKGTTVVAVRVLDCAGSGTYADVIAGIDWVAAHAAHPAVANLSLGGGPNQAVDDAVKGLIASGVTTTVAAGGSASDACNFSPARVRPALTVGATDRNDVVASSTNVGQCVDLYAPGVEITSAWITSDTATATLTGSSMSAPQVAGVAALFLDQHPNASAGATRSAIVRGATRGRISGLDPDSHNRLLFSRLS